MKYIFVVTAALFLMACGQKPKTTSVSTQGFFEGKWEANRLVVIMHGVFGGEQDSMFTVAPNEFLSKLRVKPHTALFNADGTYIEQYYDEKDTVILTNGGRWATRLDTLSLSQVTPFVKNSKYKFIPSIDSLGNSIGLNLYQLVDFDFDGKEDDEYALFMIRYQPKEEEKSWWEDLFS